MICGIIFHMYGNEKSSRKKLFFFHMWHLNSVKCSIHESSWQSGCIFR